VAFEVGDCFQECADIKSRGDIILGERHLSESLNEIIAFVKDPDGYKIELVQTNIKLEEYV
jgi:lactoylglutathione lyase